MPRLWHERNIMAMRTDSALRSPNSGPLFLGLALLLALAPFARAGTPLWWAARGAVITNEVVLTNDFAAANLGLLKNMATAAAGELQDRLAGGAGTGVLNMVNGFDQSGNFSAATLGQLKAVAQPFYDRLAAAGWPCLLPDGMTTNQPYPWTGSGAQDFAVANLGQMKYVFSFTVLRMQLIPDYNHDRKIDDADRARLSSNETYRFWINDDADNGDVASDGSDVPGQTGSSANYADCQVHGRCDLPDYFPVYLDIGQAVQCCPTTDFRYVIKQANGALNGVPTTLKADSENEDYKPEAYQIRSNVAQSMMSATLQQITCGGVEVTGAGMTNAATTGEGFVMLFEGRSVTTNPLVLEIQRRSDDHVIAGAQMPLSLSCVTNMYRYLNLRNVCGDTSGGASHTSEPSNYPDSLCGDKHVVFIHGFNENADAGRGNIAETFKRLYWSGSKAKYTGVAWCGDQGSLPTYYHANVTNAFATAPAFAQYIGTLQGDVNVIAFSLGNMVVGSAIQDYQAHPSRYFMLHAAVAQEAYDVSAYEPDMRQSDWRPYTNRLYASKWHEIFPAGDGRCSLCWTGRLASVVGPQVYNFWSSGEDVLGNLTTGGIPPFDLSLLWQAMHGRYAWCLQELWKGRHGDWLGGSTYGGWGFTDDHACYTATTDEYNNVTWTLWDAATANQQATSLDLKAVPFFNSSDPVGSVVQDPTNSTGAGSQFATTNRTRLLAEMIPALSFATGANRLNNMDNDHNFNMNGMMNGWPADRTDDNGDPAWFHGDYHAVAYLYTYKVFDKIVKDLGTLNQ